MAHWRPGSVPLSIGYPLKTYHVPGWSMDQYTLPAQEGARDGRGVGANLPERRDTMTLTIGTPGVAEHVLIEQPVYLLTAVHAAVGS